MIFVTVGTEYPFDRLIRYIDLMYENDVFSDGLFAQIGYGGAYQPKHLPWVEMLSRDEYDIRLAKCKAIISHAGMGTIIRCREIGKPLLVMPRMASLNEAVNNHQIITARRFAERGDILVAYDESQLKMRVRELLSFSPQKRFSEAGRIVGRIKVFLDQLEKRKHP